MEKIAVAELESVRTHPKHIDDYISVVGEKPIAEIKKLAARLKGKRLLNINATAYGGGVAEILCSQVPLMRDLGIDAHWQVIKAPDQFYNITKTFHNSLQGKNEEISQKDIDFYLDIQKEISKSLVESFDFVIVHDPQPLGMASFVNVPIKHWIWRCHIDTSLPNQQLWDYFCPYIANYEAVIFTMKDFVYKEASFNNITFIPPSIDPLTPKNINMPISEVNNLLKSYNVDPERPLLVQVSRFDPWKDPIGVIDVYRNLKKNIDGLQLVLVGSMANDDPEGWLVYDRVMRKAGEDFDVHVYSNFHGVGNVGVSAFQHGADLIMQKSLKEGFGLTVTEAMWKKIPVVGGNVGGIRLQIEEGKTGFLVNDIPEAVSKSFKILNNKELGKEMGIKGREKVLNNFLCIHEIEKTFELLLKLESNL